MKKREIAIHIIACLIFLSFPFLFSPDLKSENLLRVPPFQKELVTYVLLVLFFYANYFFLIPRLYFNKKYILFSTSIIASYFALVCIPMLIIGGHGGENFGHPPGDGLGPGFGPPPGRRELFFLFFISRPFLQFAVVCVLSFMLKIYSRWKQAEEEKISAELSFLKAQINPHFLFNTLNSIYALAISRSEQTPDAIVKLSGMMRYIITETASDFVPLEKELAYISDYIDLQKLRLDKSVKLNYTVSGEAFYKNIAPLIFITFIENAFKYGVNAEEDSLIDISLHMTDKEVVLNVANNLVPVSEEMINSSVGIENTRNRLQLLYPSRHTLLIEQTETQFKVNLHIRIS